MGSCHKIYPAGLLTTMYGFLKIPSILNMISYEQKILILNSLACLYHCLDHKEMQLCIYSYLYTMLP